MAEQTFGERTEQATPKRRDQARREGKVARSTELNQSLVLLAGVGALAALGGRMLGGIAAIMGGQLQQLGNASSYANESGIYSMLVHTAGQVLMLLLPMAAVIAVVGLGSNVLQVGFLATSRPVTPRLAAISPVEGFKRIFSLRSGVELLKALFKVSIIGLVAWITVKGDMDQIVPLAGADGGLLLERIGGATVKLGLRVGTALLVLAVLDYGYQRWEFERSIRMTRQEILDEQKQTEGDPLVKARVRALQRLMSRRRMMRDVQTADVVITNPTHYAVALKYNRDSMAAPVVVARGMRKLALKIREMAKKHSVPVVEDPPLARLLYKESRLGHPIPVSLYRAVAQVLAHVWRLRRQASQAAGAGL